MNSEQKNTEKIENIIPSNSIFLGKDKNGHIMYQLGRFVISCLHSSSEDLVELCESKKEPKTEPKTEKIQEKVN